MGAWATSSCLHVSTILSVFFPSSPGNAFNLLLPPIRQVESFLFISAEAEEENTVVALPSPPPTSKTALAFRQKLIFHRGWRQLLGEAATSTKPVHHDNADWTLEDAKHWSKYNILMLLLYFWPLCGSEVDSRPQIQEEIMRCNTAAAILMSYSPCWYGKMAGRLREGLGRSEVQQRPRESITLR